MSELSFYSVDSLRKLQQQKQWTTYLYHSDLQISTDMETLEVTPTVYYENTIIIRLAFDSMEVCGYDYPRDNFVRFEGQDGQLIIDEIIGIGLINTDFGDVLTFFTNKKTPPNTYSIIAQDKDSGDVSGIGGCEIEIEDLN